MKNYPFIFLILSLIYSCKSAVESTQPITGTITESVYASGNVKAREQYNVYSTVSGILQSIHVNTGDSVNRGDTLFILENIGQQLNSENALAALELSKENAGTSSDLLRELQLSIDLAKERLALDSSLYERQKAIWNQGIGSKQELDQRHLNFLASEKAFQTATTKLSQVKSQVKTDLKRAGINYEITRKNANDFVIRSQISGVVFDILKEKNELVTTQTPLAVLGDSKEYQLELEIDEFDVVKLLPGQKVLVTMDSYANQVFEGVVTQINPIMNERSRTFTVEAAFVHPPALLFPNLSVEANIVINSKQNAITIPLNYLIDERFIYVSKTEKREVKTGLKDYQKVEITEGLNSGQTIFLPENK